MIIKKDLNQYEIKKEYNKDEVLDVKFVKKQELLDLINKNEIEITPWFKLLIKHKINDLFSKAENFELMQNSEDNDNNKFNNTRNIEIKNYI